MRPGQQYRTLSKALVGGSCGKRGTKRFLALSVPCAARCQSLAQRPCRDLTGTSASAARVLCHGCMVGLGTGGRCGHPLLPIRSCTTSRWPSALDCSALLLHRAWPSLRASMVGKQWISPTFLPLILQVRLHLCITRRNTSFRNDPPFWPYLAKVHGRSLNLSR